MDNLVVQFSITFFLALGIGVLVTGAVRKIAQSMQVLDVPNVARKIHAHPVPLLGGVALFVTFVLSVLFLQAVGWLEDDRVPEAIIRGIVIAGALIVFVGFLDDKYRLAWWQQMIGPVAAILIMLTAGLGIPFITNPFGAGVLDLDLMRMGSYTIPTGTILVFLWFLGMMYTTKLLDGLDGLTTSISIVAMIVIFIVSLFWDRSGSTISFFALVIAGAALGFLFWNWYPAKIFLGEGGSIFLGFMLAVLAIISGGKIATALLVMGVPILDVAWIIGRRLITGKKIFAGDNKHLHFRLLHAGMSQRQVVLSLSFLSLAFGSVSFFFTTRAKMIALGLLVIVMFSLAIILITRYEQKEVQS